MVGIRIIGVGLTMPGVRDGIGVQTGNGCGFTVQSHAVNIQVRRRSGNNFFIAVFYLIVSRPLRITRPLGGSLQLLKNLNMGIEFFGDLCENKLDFVVGCPPHPAAKSFNGPIHTWPVFGCHSISVDSSHALQPTCHYEAENFSFSSCTDGSTNIEPSGKMMVGTLT